jgi:hypothetical protein
VPLLHREPCRQDHCLLPRHARLRRAIQGPDEEPFFAIVGRDRASLFLKAGEAIPLPNPRRDAAMRWDAYCHTPDPDALAAEFSARGAPFYDPLKDWSDGLRGFEITDPDGYVLFFGRPREADE